MNLLPGTEGSRPGLHGRALGDHSASDQGRVAGVGGGIDAQGRLDSASVCSFPEMDVG